jgi:hypothetical protein
MFWFPLLPFVRCCPRKPKYLSGRRLGWIPFRPAAWAEPEGAIVLFPPDYGHTHNHNACTLGMQAARVSPPTRWVNPRRIPATPRKLARIREVGISGQPAKAAGAAEPAKKSLAHLPSPLDGVGSESHRLSPMVSPSS